MKLVTLALLLTSALLLAACESTAATARDTSGNGTALGDSNVRVSGFVESGGAAHAR